MAGIHRAPPIGSNGYSALPSSEEHYDDNIDTRSDGADSNDPLANSSVSLADSQLPAVADSIPVTAWLIGVIEAGERFAFFGMQGPLQNYIQLPSKGGLRHGGLGLGQKNATIIKLLFTAWCYFTPIFAAVAADQYLGRYRTVLYSAIPYILGLAVLTASSMLVDIEGSRIPTEGLIFAMLAIGIGTGGIKANVSPLTAEQYHMPENTEVYISKGKKGRVDYEATMQRLFLLLFMFVNLGAFGALVTAAIEQKFGFVWAYLLTLVVFCICAVVLVATRRLYTKTRPSGSILLNSARILKITMVSGMDLDSAKPDNQAVACPWDAELVDEVRQALAACRVFVLLPIWWCAYSQMITNLISQAGTMKGSIPNDVLLYTDSLVVLIVAPIFDRVVYPFLNQNGIHFTPVRRIAVGFFICAIAMGYATLLQSQIYASAPCYEFPLSDTCEGGRVPNDINMLWQLPVYILIAISELFVAVTSLELSYASAPKSMKSLVTAVVLCTNAAGMLMAMAFAQLAEDPLMIWFYGSLTLAVFLGGLLFCYAFRHTLRSGHVVTVST